MRKSAKGALAAAAAAVLLLGGAGSLAFWTSTQDVAGGDINSGHLALLTDGTNTGCGAWTLDSAEQAPLVYADGDPLVPGDVLSKVCKYTIDAAGNHLRATITAVPDALTGDAALIAALTVNASGILVGSEVTPRNPLEFTEADDGQALSVTVTVTFANPNVADNTTNVSTGLSAVLNTIHVVATQVHA